MNPVSFAVKDVRHRILQSGPISQEMLAEHIPRLRNFFRKEFEKAPDDLQGLIKMQTPIFKESADGMISIQYEETTSEKQALNLFLDLMMAELNVKIHTLVGPLANAPKSVMKVGGRNANGIRNFMQNHPSLFNVANADSDTAQLTTALMIDNLNNDSPNVADSNSITLRAVYLCLAYGIYRIPLPVLFQDLHASKLIDDDTDININDLKSTLVQSAFFHVSLDNLVEFNAKKLTNKALLVLYISALIENEDNLLLENLAEAIKDFHLTRVLGADTLHGLLKLIDETSTLLRIEFVIGLASHEETQILEYIYNIVKRKKKIHIRSLSCHLSQRCNHIGATILQMEEFLDDYNNIFDISADCHVILHSSTENVVNYFRNKLETKGEIAYRNVHAFIQHSPANVKSLAISTIHNILLSRTDTFFLTQRDGFTLKKTCQENISVQTEMAPIAQAREAVTKYTKSVKDKSEISTSFSDTTLEELCNEGKRKRKSIKSIGGTVDAEPPSVVESHIKVTGSSSGTTLGATAQEMPPSLDENLIKNDVVVTTPANQQEEASPNNCYNGSKHKSSSSIPKSTSAPIVSFSDTTLEELCNEGKRKRKRKRKSIKSRNAEPPSVVESHIKFTGSSSGATLGATTQEMPPSLGENLIENDVVVTTPANQQEEASPSSQRWFRSTFFGWILVSSLIYKMADRRYIGMYTSMDNINIFKKLLRDNINIFKKLLRD